MLTSDNPMTIELSGTPVLFFLTTVTTDGTDSVMLFNAIRLTSSYSLTGLKLNSSSSSNTGNIYTSAAYVKKSGNSLVFYDRWNSGVNQRQTYNWIAITI